MKLEEKVCHAQEFGRMVGRGGEERKRRYYSILHNFYCVLDIFPQESLIATFNRIVVASENKNTKREKKKEKKVGTHESNRWEIDHTQ